MTPSGLAREAEQRDEPAWPGAGPTGALRDAGDRSASRTELFLAAATALLSETGGVDFTVQEVVSRAGLSLRSFYQHFAGKEELMLALFGDVIDNYVASLREKVAEFDDPVDQLRALVTDLYRTADAVGTAGNLLPRALTLYHQRLAGTHPGEVARALEPQVGLVREIIEAGAGTGRFRDDVGAGQLATIVSQTLIGVGHMNVLGTHVTGVQVGMEDLWAFCLAGVRPPGRPGRGGERGGDRNG